VTSPIRILFLEDDPEDVELIQALFEADQFACEISRVETKAEFLFALQESEFDLILVDYTLPSFDGLSALALARKVQPDLPFIFVSGTLGEEVAIEALKVGATDYVLKTRLSRLAPAARRALREVQEKNQRKEAEAALRRGEEVQTMLQAQADLLDLAHDAIFVYDMNGVITFWNRGAQSLYGWSPGEAKGKIASELLKTAFPTPLELKEGHWEGEFVRTAKGGAQVIVASRWSLQRDVIGKPAAILETNNDITKRKQAEDSLRRSEKELRDVIEAIPVISFAAKPDGACAWVNQRWVEYTGLSLEETTGPQWRSVIHSDDIDRHAAKWSRSTATGEPFEIESRYRSASGEYRWFLARAVPLRDDRGEILKWCGTLTDIEDRKRADGERERLRELEADLAHKSRVSMMGEFAASLGHEITQPIQGALLNAKSCLRWLEREIPDIEEACQSASRAVHDLSRAADIVERNRSLYRRSVAHPESVDVNDVIRQMMALLGEMTIRQSVSVRAELAPDLPPATADRVQLQQVLMNLMLNAIEAMRQGSGTLEVVSRRTEAGQLMVSVSDSGIGLPSEPEDIFEAFYTTKPDGTGMGLSISRRIIESHGGRLWAHANNGPGATFCFTLPVQANA
jgi:PAS domain S-box-containing protein